MKKKKLRVFLNERIKWWIHWLGIGFWNITVVFSDKKKTKPDGSLLCGRTYVSWKYMSAYITLYLPCLKDLSPQRLEEIVIHELVHILINEMRDYHKDPDHEERVVTGIQKAFSWVVGAVERKEGKYERTDVR